MAGYPFHTHVCPECEGYWEHGGVCNTHHLELICPSCESTIAIDEEHNDAPERSPDEPEYCLNPEDDPEYFAGCDLGDETGW